MEAAAAMYDFDRANTIEKFTQEQDLAEMPLTTKVLEWEHFNVDLWSSQRNLIEVADICAKFSHKLVDLRPYLIEEPPLIHITDKLPKVLDMFRYFHLRALPVIDPNDGSPVAVLTRADLFSYMNV